ncbi:hypothetical protein [Xanthobacter sp. 126]|uniref:hypothetical protein n=1 Tax=Xanthobacter sp. 126 TaxID=1131814 RepID=UPI00045EC3A0|nr:hypothetical protein [Xanthobacter sp. 126]
MTIAQIASGLCSVTAAVCGLLGAFWHIPDVPTKMFMGVGNAGVPAVIKAIRMQSRFAALAALFAGAGAIISLVF